MSLREIVRELVVAKRQQEHRRARDLSLAWHVAAFGYPRKLPKFDDVMKNTGHANAPHKQSALHHMAALAQIGFRGIPARELAGG